MSTFFSAYGICMVLSFLTAAAAFLFLRGKGGRKLPETLAVLLLGACFGCAFSRLNVLLFGGYASLQRGFFSPYPYDYSVFGAILGLFLGAALACFLCRGTFGQILDDLALPALLFLVLARVSEVQADFGWGAILSENVWLPSFFITTDMYSMRHLAVYALEAVGALLVLCAVWRMHPGRTGDRFLHALILFALTQMLLESLRAETLRNGFVRIQQIEFAVTLLLIWIFRLRKDPRGAMRRTVLATLLMVAVTAFCEYALDKITVIPAPVTYLIMAAGLVFTGVVGLRNMRRTE